MVRFPLPGEGGAPQRGENDATDEPEDSPRRLQALILSIFIDQTGLQREPLMPKASNHRGAGEESANRSPDPTPEAQCLQPQGGRRGCNQSARGCPQEAASADFVFLY